VRSGRVGARTRVHWLHRRWILMDRMNRLRGWRIEARTCAHTQTCTHTHLHSHTPAKTQACSPVHTHTYARTCTQVAPVMDHVGSSEQIKEMEDWSAHSTHTSLHSHTPAKTQACSPVHTHTHARTCTQVAPVMDHVGSSEQIKEMEDWSAHSRTHTKTQACTHVHTHSMIEHT
jgi:hypothetical protein